jgi:D-beta-D-heptose 7-phosphate kinase/D-beta-D-heptose 1-phosphate adenosyltransferase
VTADLVRCPTKPTTVKTRFSVGQHQILRLDRADSSTASEACEREILDAIEKRIAHCSLVVLSDYNKGMLTGRILAQTIEWARARGVPIVVDPKRRDFAAYRGATYIKPNLAELELATGLPVASNEDIDRAAAVVAAETGANVLITRSEAGMSLIRPESPAIHMSTHAREVFDVTGAGDTAIAAFALGLASNHSALAAMAFANLAAGIAVSKPGTAIVLAEEIEAERSLLADGEVISRGALVSAEAAVRLRRIWKRQGLVVGFTNGCFDLLHPGHVALLREAAQSCDRLILGLNSDASVRRLKGNGRPVQTEADRAAVLGAIEHVNLVVVFDEDTPAGLIDLLVPDLLVKGADYKIEDIVGAETVKKAGGQVMTVQLVPGQSTTRLVATSAVAPIRRAS